MAAPWQFFITFPNLVPPVPSPFETEEVYLCAATDPRLRLLERGEPTKTARLMLRRFSSTLGDRYKPGCLLVRADTPPDVRAGEAIRAFRNACSIATVSRAWAASIAHASAGPWTAKWSDFFLMGYHTPGKDGSLVNLHGIVRGMDDAERLAHLRAQSSPQIGDPTNFSVYVDEGLLRRLLVAWRRVYVQSLQRRTFRRLFRALEVAFHAAQYPGDGLPSLTDAGNRLALWASAFKILFHRVWFSCWTIHAESRTTGCGTSA